MASLPDRIKESKRAGRISRALAFTGGTIMRSRITKLAAAAVIIVAILFGLKIIGGPDMSNVAWAKLVQRVEQSHDGYMKQLLLAIEVKDTEKIEFYADLLDEFWQKLGWLARAELHPEHRARILAQIAAAKDKYDKREESDQTGIQIFLKYSEKFSKWLGETEDVAWLNETIHVCKQMEEYAEEIRDAHIRSEDDLPHIEHCMSSFLVYSGWFKQLPWDDPSEYMGLDVLLAAIERDLKIAHFELETLQIRGADRFVKRCVQQARKNVLDLEKKTTSSRTEQQRDLCRQLTRRIDHLSELLTYAIIASWDIQQSHKVGADAAFSQVLRKEFGGIETFGAHFLDEIDESLKLCKELSQNFESQQ
jgi:hypothetical protein